MPLYLASMCVWNASLALMVSSGKVQVTAVQPAAAPATNFSPWELGSMQKRWGKCRLYVWGEEEIEQRTDKIQNVFEVMYASNIRPKKKLR